MGNNYLSEEQIDVIDRHGVMLAHGFNAALLGLSHRANEPVLAVYSYEAMVNVCVERDGMDYEDAIEYVDFYVIDQWVGPKTPIVVMDVLLW